MKIELKNVKVHEDMSEETTCFTAEVWADGEFVGTAKNDGHGGCTDIYNHSGTRELLQKVEEYCKTLPNHVYPATKHSKEFSVSMDLEQMVHNLLDEAMFINDIKKYFNKGIIYGKMLGDIHQRGYKTSIAALKKTEEGRKMIEGLVAGVQMNLKEGERIFNTNINEFLK